MDSDKYARVVAALDRLTPDQLAQLGAWLDAVAEPGLQLPIDSQPSTNNKNGKYTLVGYDTFDGEFYDLATFDTEQEAVAAARLRMVELERTQPSASSGGQGMGGIQDRTYIRNPQGLVTRV